MKNHFTNGLLGILLRRLLGRSRDQLPNPEATFNERARRKRSRYVVLPASGHLLPYIVESEDSEPEDKRRR